MRYNCVVFHSVSPNPRKLEGFGDMIQKEVKMRSIMNKKGAEFTIGMIIALILGLIVLVVVALGFSYGWNNLWTKMNVFTGGGSLATIGQACKISCSARDNVAFCSQGRDVSDLTLAQVKSVYPPIEYPATLTAEIAAETDATKHDKIIEEHYDGKVSGKACKDLVVIGVEACPEITCP